MLAIAKRIIKQIIGDKRSLVMILIAPLFILTLMYLLLGKSSYTPTLALDATKLSPAFVSALKEQTEVIIVEKDSTVSDEDFIRDKKADAVLSAGTDGMTITMLEMDSVRISKVTDAIKAASAMITPQSQLQMNYIYGSANESTFDSLAFYLLAVLAFFIVFLVAGISFVRERTSNTLERLMRTPVKTISVVTGYSLGFGAFAVLQSIIMILFAKFVLNTPFVGEWWIATIFMLLIAVTAVMMGILVSVVSKTEFQVVQFIPIVIIPQMFFSGLIPVDTLPYHLNYLSKIMPLYYGGIGLKEVMVFGYGLTEVLPYILVLIGFIVLLFGANMLAVSKYRRS